MYKWGCCFCWCLVVLCCQQDFKHEQISNYIDYCRLEMNLNLLPRYKEKAESSFRVHFYLKNVYYNGEVKLPVFLQDTANRISKVVEVNLLQIYGSIRKIVDLSVGMKSDAQACTFIQAHKKIMLPGESGKLVEHQPVFSESFKLYFRHIHERQEQATTTANIQKQQLVKFESAQLIDPPPRQLSGSRKAVSEQESILKKYETQNQRCHIILIFCIPLQFKEREVLAVLAEKGIKSKYYEWKFKEDMEFLQVELAEPMFQRDISAIDLRIEKYPLLVMPKVHEEFINAIIMKLQVQLNFEKDIDEVDLMKKADHVGGVISIIKDEFYGPRKYNIAFNNLPNLMRFQEIVELCYKTCRVTKPRYIVRLCRLEKSFTFSQMMENSVFYELELKKMKDLSPDKMDN